MENLILDESDILKKEEKRYVNDFSIELIDLLDLFIFRYQPLEWNRILSEYAAAKWRCLFLVCTALAKSGIQIDLKWTELAEHALTALDTISGAEEIHCVMQCTGHILKLVSL